MVTQAAGPSPAGAVDRIGMPEAIADLERVAAAAWVAPDREYLGDWLLRAAGGWTGRANSVLPVGDPGMPLPAALARIGSWYAARGLPARINVPLPLRDELSGALTAQGWTQAPLVLVQTADLETVLAAAAHVAAASARATGGRGTGREAAPPVRLDPEPDADWLRLVAGRKGGLPDVALPILLAGPLVRFASVRTADGELLAAARVVVDGDWLGLFLIEVVPHARRRGLARHAIAETARWAVANGARRAYLQVEAHNAPAVELYRRLSFATHHRYISHLAPPVDRH